MDIRKLQKTGGSTFVVSLPKSWVTSLGLKKNDSVIIQVQPDSSLLITPHKGRPLEEKKLKKTLRVSDDSKKYLERELVGAYVMGHEIMEVCSGSFISQDVRTIVRDFTGKVMSIEIVDEVVNKIILKDIMNPGELPFDTTIKRMFNIVKSMHNNTLFALDHMDKNMAKNVISMDFEVNKLYWFVFRHLSIILRHPTKVQLSNEKNISFKSAINYFLIARNLERIGDHLENIANAILELDSDELYDPLLQNMGEVSGKVFATLEKCMGTLFTKDVGFLNTVFESIEVLQPEFKTMRSTIRFKEAIHGLQLGQILDSIRRMGEYTKDIAEYMINHIVDLESYTGAGTRKKGKEK